MTAGGSGRSHQAFRLVEPQCGNGYASTARNFSNAQLAVHEFMPSLDFKLSGGFSVVLVGRIGKRMSRRNLQW